MVQNANDSFYSAVWNTVGALSRGPKKPISENKYITWIIKSFVQKTNVTKTQISKSDPADLYAFYARSLNMQSAPLTGMHYSLCVAWPRRVQDKDDYK